MAWALGQIRGTQAQQVLSERLNIERDEYVRDEISFDILTFFKIFYFMLFFFKHIIFLTTQNNNNWFFLYFFVLFSIDCCNILFALQEMCMAQDRAKVSLSLSK